MKISLMSNLHPQLQRWQPALWLRGHFHHSCDYRIGATRVLTNPRGYAPGGAVENPAFDAALTIKPA